MFSVHFFLIALSLFSSATSSVIFSHSVRQSSALPSACPTVLPTHASPSNRIIGGDVASLFLRSHLVSFHSNGCGGSILSSNWVLTAAHCKITDDSTVYLGGSDFLNGYPAKVKRTFVHPDYEFPKNDIALVELVDPAPKRFQSVLVSEESSIPRLGEFARAVGYGYTKQDGDDDRDGLLRQVDVPVVGTKTCRSEYSKVNSRLAPSIEQPMHICAGYEEGGCDSCLADSGGPLFVYDDKNNPIQIAIVSFGYGCALPKLAGGYTRLTTYVDWMREVGASFTTVSANNPVFGPSSPTPRPVPTSPTSSPSTTSPTTNTTTTTTTITVPITKPSSSPSTAPPQTTDPKKGSSSTTIAPSTTTSTKKSSSATSATTTEPSTTVTTPKPSPSAITTTSSPSTTTASTLGTSSTTTGLTTNTSPTSTPESDALAPSPSVDNGNSTDVKAEAVAGGSGLSGGAVAGVTIGAIVAVAVIAGVAYKMWFSGGVSSGADAAGTV